MDDRGPLRLDTDADPRAAQVGRIPGHKGDVGRAQNAHHPGVKPLFFHPGNQLFEDRAMGHIDQSVMLVFIEGRADADHHFIGTFIGRSYPALAGFQGKEG